MGARKGGGGVGCKFNKHGSMLYMLSGQGRAGEGGWDRGGEGGVDGKLGRWMGHACPIHLPLLYSL